jgi:uncharacterized Zn-finger protein
MVKLADIPIHNLFSLGSMEIVSPVDEEKSRFKCSECSKSYLGIRDLLRHQMKHTDPDRYSCTVAGCKIKNYRIDGMRSHIKTHERRIKKGQDQKN